VKPPDFLEEIALGGEGMFEAKFYGLGADGTVGANKNSVKIIGGSEGYVVYDTDSKVVLRHRHSQILEYGNDLSRSSVRS